MRVGEFQDCTLLSCREWESILVIEKKIMCLSFKKFKVRQCEHKK